MPAFAGMTENVAADHWPTAAVTPSGSRGGNTSASPRLRASA